jgi:hypothetical protein
LAKRFDDQTRRHGCNLFPLVLAPVATLKIF